MDESNGRSRDVIQSLERGMAVLREFASHGAPMSVSELAGAVGLTRPAVRRILLTFEYLGYARQSRGVWSLTPRVLELASGYYVRGSLPEIAGPFLETIVDELTETCAVTVLDDAEVIHVAVKEFRRVTPDPMRAGAPLPAHATAFGKVLLSGLDAQELDAYFQHGPFEAYTAHTPTDEKRLRELVVRAREDGYYISEEELISGALAIAVPIRAQGVIIGALGSTSTTFRSSTEKLRTETLPILQRVANDIAQAYEAGNRHWVGDGQRSDPRSIV